MVPSNEMWSVDNTSLTHSLKICRLASDLCEVLEENHPNIFISGDHKKLKQDAVCNFDFLLAATRGASISYTRSILEIVRCQVRFVL